MADDGAEIQCNTNIGDASQAFSINITKDPSRTSPLPGGEAPRHDVNVKKAAALLLALVAKNHSMMFRIWQLAVSSEDFFFLVKHCLPALLQLFICWCCSFYIFTRLYF